MKKAGSLIGRLIFGGFFVYNGIHHFQERKALAGYAASKNIPQPELAVAASGALILAGGLSIILGAKPHYGAAAILAFLAGVSPAMHNFWDVEDPQRRQGEMINFSKNMALLGAALILMSKEEEWPLSVAG
jgi:uncharacterized membrane protein YphA (DoxX/SURF4 family)